MTKEEKYIREHLGNESHFRVPEGYFDSLVPKVMERLPEHSDAKIIELRPSLLYRLRPLLYVAACMFVAVLSFSIYMDGTGDEETESTMTAQTVTGESEFDEVADYMMMDANDIYACLTTDY
ncbi:MAG: hypothetical protein IJ081_02495 [Prevotella sp.]|nr:hypothetical protein [Prevotella sp.]